MVYAWCRFSWDHAMRGVRSAVLEGVTGVRGRFSLSLWIVRGGVGRVVLIVIGNEEMVRGGS